eukprot:scaffold6737_cov101-Isochrysis_galbana.AAC.3
MCEEKTSSPLAGGTPLRCGAAGAPTRSTTSPLTTKPDPVLISGPSSATCGSCFDAIDVTPRPFQFLFFGALF